MKPCLLHRCIEKAFMSLCFLALIIPLLLLFAFLAKIASIGFSRLHWGFLTSFPSRFPELAGIFPAMMGTICLTTLTAAIALPVGVGAAVYLEEYAGKNRFFRFVEMNIANLAGVPSVIYGLLGLAIFVRFFQIGTGLLSAAMTMSLLILPVVITTSREALRTVSPLYREAAFGLGASHWQTIRQIILPLALPGILTGAILSVSRVIGEAAPLVVVGAAAYVAFLPDALDDDYTVLPIQIFNWISRPQKGFLLNAAGAILILMLVLLILNAFAIYVRNRYAKTSGA